MNEQSDTRTTAGSPPEDRVRAHAADVERVASDAKAVAADKLEQVKGQTREAGEQLKSQAKGATDKARARGEEMLRDQKQKVASEIQTYCAAARRAAQRLDEDSDTNLAGYVSSAADYLDRFGRSIEEKDIGEIVDDVRLAARQRPELFLGGLFVAGLVAARFLKASNRDRRRNAAPENDTGHWDDRMSNARKPVGTGSYSASPPSGTPLPVESDIVVPAAGEPIQPTQGGY